jgi:hypothetical protein
MIHFFPGLKERFFRKILQYQFQDDQFARKGEYKRRLAVIRTIWITQMKPNFVPTSSVSWHRTVVSYAATNILQKHTASNFMVEVTYILKIELVVATKLRYYYNKVSYLEN